MKFPIVTLAFVSAGLMWEANAILLESIERYWTASPTNSIIYTPNQSEFEQEIEFKKEISADHPLLLTAEITEKDTGMVKYSAEGLSICAKYDDAFQSTAVRLFDRSLIPGPKRRKCPVVPQTYTVLRYGYDLSSDIQLDPGSYEFSYTAKSDSGELVFSTLKFRFTVNPSSGFWG